MNNNNFKSIFSFIVLTAIVTVGWYYLGPKPDPVQNPPPDTAVKLPKITQEQAAAIGGTAILGGKPFDGLKPGTPPVVEKPVAEIKPITPAVTKPSEPPAFIALGDSTFHLKVLLTDRGAGVQQLILTKFDEANRLGEQVYDSNKKPRPLYLIPGFLRPLYTHIKVPDEADYPDIVANFTEADLAANRKPDTSRMATLAGVLARPSYTMYHYPSKDDQYRARDERGQAKSEDDLIPLAILGEVAWKVASIKQPKDAPWEVVFETELGAPYFLKLRKTFALSPKDYDFKLRVDIEAMPGRLKESGKFRYQISGPVGMPIEGEWYTSTFRTAYFGWLDGQKTPRRAVDDSSNIHYLHGGNEVRKPGIFNYAAVGTQYFASAIAQADDVDESNQPWEYVRPTREVPAKSDDERVSKYEPEKHALFDISVRAVTRLYEVAPGETISHNYAVYNGPMKVRLLKQMKGDSEVPAETIDRYLTKYHLDTLTDFHSPSWIGRRADSIYWSSLIIASTNVMHWLLGTLHSYVGNWGLSIMLLTVLVRIALLVPSRRQQMINAHMQAKILKLKPETDKINEKYKDDFMTLQQEKSKLFRKAGISQSAQLGGCMLIFAQMPIFMGLYFCLQESVFFRLQEFLWIPNLAAPDMLMWWSENIPFISTPAARFGGFSFLYLGPFWNILPLATVVLFFLQQKLTMPPPTDDMQIQQQKMMKFMLIFTALFFYKVAAGLCLYFIISGLWTLLERKLVPKPDLSKAESMVSGGGDGDEPPKDSTTTAPAPKPTGWLARKIADAKGRMEELQRTAETQRQIRNDPNASSNTPQQGTGNSRAERRQKKKRRK